MAGDRAEAERDRDQLAVRHAPVPRDYDAYTRHRQIYEANLEKRALQKLGEAEQIGVPTALNEARTILERTTTEHPEPAWSRRTEALADLLFQKIGYQTSVPNTTAAASSAAA